MHPDGPDMPEQAADAEGPSGRLALSWANQHKALLTRDDGTSYEWVDRRDHRVAEVRLLRDAGVVGQADPEAERAADNLLIRGDALHALTALNQLPEFSKHYAGKVKCACFDPPFNTGQAFAQYDDGLKHSVWLTLMRDRLEQVKELLSDDGSVWVHLDDSEVAYCRVMMDDIFGRDNFVASVIWRSADTGNHDETQFSLDHNTILVFSKRPGWRANAVERTAQQRSHFANPDNDARGPWFDGNPVNSPDLRENLRYAVTSPQGHVIQPPDNGWRWSRSTLDDRLREGSARFSDDGRRIIYRTYLADMDDLPPSTLWDSTDETGSNRKAKNELKRLFKLKAAEVFDTPKPERLLQRVLHVATNPGDIVLDAFAGSGTTAAVAHKMGRRWVTSEASEDTVDRFTAPRLRKVVEGGDSGGITKDVGWKGGGSFHVLNVGPSMYATDFGVVVLNEWVHNGQLSRAVAAQLHFPWQPDDPFCGQRGRMRLAVIDGHADAGVVRILVGALPEGQRLSLAATSLDDEAGALLAALCPGSQTHVVPHDLLLAYRTPSSWRAAVARESPEQQHQVQQQVEHSAAMADAGVDG